MARSHVGIWVILLSPETTNLLAIGKATEALAAVNFPILLLNGGMNIWLLLFCLLLFCLGLGGCISLLLLLTVLLDVFRFISARTRRGTTVMATLHTLLVAILAGWTIIVLGSLVATAFVTSNLQCIETPVSGLDKIGKLSL